MYHKESLTLSSTVILCTNFGGQRWSEFHLVGLENSNRLRRRQYDPVIIERTIGAPLAFGPELAYGLRVAQPTLMDVTRYFWYNFILLHMFVYHILRPLHFGWLWVLNLHKEDYLQIFKCVSFSFHDFCSQWEGWVPVNRFNHTSWMTFVTPTDRPKSVHNRCVVEVFGGVVCIVTLLLGFFCGCRAFRHRSESDLLLFLLDFGLNIKHYLLNLKWVSYRLHDCYLEWQGLMCKPVNHTIWIANTIPSERLTWVCNLCTKDHFCYPYVTSFHYSDNGSICIKQILVLTEKFFFSNRNVDTALWVWIALQSFQ